MLTAARSKTPRRSLGVLCSVLALQACVTPRPSPAQTPWESTAWDAPWASSAYDPALSDPPQERDRWEAQDTPTPRQDTTSLAPSSSITEVAYRVYRDYITHIDGARCPCRPTCSRYAVQAARKHGLLIGTWMTLDRLILSTDETRSSALRSLPLREVTPGQHYYYDPVEENDFFF